LKISVIRSLMPALSMAQSSSRPAISGRMAPRR
jgi:hypothetical protein